MVWEVGGLPVSDCYMSREEPKYLYEYQLSKTLSICHIESVQLLIYSGSRDFGSGRKHFSIVIVVPRGFGQESELANRQTSER